MDIRSIFDSALDIADATGRSEYLDDACGDDPELRRQVEELLGAQQQLGSFLEEPAPANAVTITNSEISERAGSTIGPYKLREQIGEGGFGIVYLAEQTEPVKRRVALKIIKPGMDTREVIARFQAERQALAMMDHPNIAKVFDAGTTETGRPYFVMELVKGIPVTEYCDQCQLSTRDRLELFVQVCRAIQHAHQKGIIHRDVKPSNVLVSIQDGHPLPKVIDFGVAKAINQRLTDQTLLTRFAQIVGTPLYMSPEQAEMSALDVDTRSDIYSLGVLLYELLTGTTPFERQRLKDATYDEVRRIIREEEPVRPSARISTLGAEVTTIAEKRRTEPRKLQQFVRGDLDWIALKALEKDRTRRYETAASFAEDINRFLNDEPVEACPPSTAYRFRKFARRNKAALSSTAAVAFAVTLVAVGASMAAIEFRNLAAEKGELVESLDVALNDATTEQQRAEDNLGLALQALDAVYLDAIGTEKLLRDPVSQPDAEDGPSSDRPRLTALEKELLRRGLVFYDQFANQNAATPHAAVQTAQAYSRVGLLHAALGVYRESESAYRDAIKRFEQLTDDEPENADHFRQLAEAHMGLSYVVADWPEARRAIEDAHNAYSNAIEVAPDDPVLYLGRSETSHRLGDDDQRHQDLETALKFAPENIEVLLKCSSLYQWARLKRRQDRDKALELAERAVELDPESPDCHVRIAGVFAWTEMWYFGRTADVQLVWDRERALDHYTRAVELAPSRADVLTSRGTFLTDMGEYPGALDDLNRALTVDPTYARALRGRFRVYRAQGKLDEALADLDTLEQLGPHERRLAHRQRGQIYMSQQNWEQARAEYDALIEIDPHDFIPYKHRARALARLGNYPAAMADMRRAFELRPEDNSIPHSGADDLEHAPDEFREGLISLIEDMVLYSPDKEEALAERGWLFTELGDYERADSSFREAVESNPDERGFPWLKWGRSYEKRELHEQAREMYSEAVRRNPQDYVYWGSRGISSYRLGDYEAALRDFDKSIELLPSAPVYSWRAASLYQLDRLDEALADLRTALERDPTAPENHHKHALLCLATGSEAEYRSSSQTMLDRFAESPVPGDANFTARTCSLAPRAVDDFTIALALARKATEHNPDDDQTSMTLGALLYRVGRHEEALEQLTELAEGMEEPDHKDDGSRVSTWYFLAMTHHALGHADDAKTWLGKANEWTEQVLTDEDEPPTWNDKLTLELLRDEANSLIDPDDSN